MTHFMAQSVFLVFWVQSRQFLSPFPFPLTSLPLSTRPCHYCNFEYSLNIDFQKIRDHKNDRLQHNSSERSIVSCGWD